jgi:hypothetical protein
MTRLAPTVFTHDGERRFLDQTGAFFGRMVDNMQTFGSTIGSAAQNIAFGLGLNSIANSIAAIAKPILEYIAANKAVNVADQRADERIAMVEQQLIEGRKDAKEVALRSIDVAERSVRVVEKGILDGLIISEKMMAVACSIGAFGAAAYINQDLSLLQYGGRSVATGGLVYVGIYCINHWIKSIEVGQVMLEEIEELEQIQQNWNESDAKFQENLQMIQNFKSKK